jgi:hypothetical protein
MNWYSTKNGKATGSTQRSPALHLFASTAKDGRALKSKSVRSEYRPCAA